jgi:hypothetical protein
MKRNDRQVVLRVPAEIWTRAVKLAKLLARRPEYVGMRVTASTAIRFAILKGLDAMESERGR